MDEMIDILTPDGKPTGKQALKSEAHQKGWFHATVHVWLFTKEEQLLLQKRALTKKVFPGLWDISVAGHVMAKEEILEAAKREVLEEIGIAFQDHELIKIGTRIHQITHQNGIQDNEFHHVFIAELKTAINHLSPQTEEIDELKLFNLDILHNTHKHKNVLLPEYHEYYNKVYRSIQEQLKK